MRRLLYALAVAAWLGPAPALAGDPEERPGYASETASIPITLRNETTTTSYTILSRDRAGVLDTCDHECTVWLEPGRYVLRVHERAGYSGGDKGFKVDEPRTYVVTQGRSSARSTGLTLGIVGTALLSVGMLAVMPAVLSSMCHGGDECRTDGGLALAGLGGIIVGAVLTPVGWSMYSRNRVHLRPEESQAY